MKRKLFLTKFGLLLIILPILTACTNSSTSPVNPLDGTQWNLIFYRKSAVIPGTQITAQFQNGEVNGTAGCNSYFGIYQVEGDSISFDQIGMTEMYCMDPEGVMEQETFYLQALAVAQGYEITADGRLTIFLGGHETLTFEPAQ